MFFRKIIGQEEALAFQISISLSGRINGKPLGGVMVQALKSRKTDYREAAPRHGQLSGCRVERPQRVAAVATSQTSSTGFSVAVLYTTKRTNLLTTK